MSGNGLADKLAKQTVLKERLLLRPGAPVGGLDKGLGYDGHESFGIELASNYSHEQTVASYFLLAACIDQGDEARQYRHFPRPHSKTKQWRGGKQRCQGFSFGSEAGKANWGSAEVFIRVEEASRAQCRRGRPSLAIWGKARARPTTA